MSSDYISDSENEDDQHKLIIDQKLLKNHLLQLTPTKRDATQKRLLELTNISYISNPTNEIKSNSTSLTGDLLQVNNDIIGDSDDSDMDTLDLIRRLPRKRIPKELNEPISSIVHDEQTETPSNTSTTYDTYDHGSVHDDQENENHLQSYLNTKNSYITMSGRSLRKRNFASTHPYLADQAHYLGLSDINYLNEIYEENQHDLENVVRYLNYNYTRLKEKYPKDEKYKSKNFYTIISRQSHLAQEKERQEEESRTNVGNNEALEHNNSRDDNSDDDDGDDDEGNREFTLNDYNSQNYETDESSNEPDDLLGIFKLHHPLIDVDDDEIVNYSSESDSSETYVRVGGKVRKEKNALRGVLPESAKRLAIYKSTRKQNRRQKNINNLMDHRKGMAVKKTTKKRHREQDDFSGFVDDTITYDTNNELYHELYDQSVEIQPLIPNGYPNNDVIDSFSDISSSSSSSSSEANDLDNDSDLDIFFLQNENSNVLPVGNTPIAGGDVPGIDQLPRIHESSNFSDVEDTQNDPLDVFDFEVREGDYINHMLATSSKGKLKGNRNKQDSSNSRKQATKIHRSGTRRKATNTAIRTSRSPNSIVRQKSSNLIQYKSRKSKTINLTDYDQFLSVGKKTRRHKKSSDDSYSRLPTKKISIPNKAHASTKSRQPRKTKKQTIRDHEVSYPLAQRPRELFANDYLFLRTPVLSTTIFEAESKTRFIKNNYKTINPSAPQIAPSIVLGSQPLFEHGCMLNDNINIRRITDLASGKFYHINKDSVTINLLGDSIVLTLVDIDRSTMKYEKSLSHLIKIFKNEKLSNDDILETFYTSIKSLLEWNLILQRTPSQKHWKLVLILTTNVLNCNFLMASQLKFMVPYCLLLQYTMAMISKLNESDSDFDSIPISVKYWQLFFETFTADYFESINIEAGARSKEAESYFVIRSLLEYENNWWPSICTAVELYEPMDIKTLLEAVSCLCASFSKQFCWEALLLVYKKADSSTDPDFYFRYLEIIYLMNQRSNWPIDEKIVLQVYSSVAARKFANFPDEIGIPDLMGKVSTRLDIPGDTFFEQFMQLLYWYISGLSDPSKVKRLVTKLFTNSSFHYINDHDHRIMFTNRLNLIILLSLVSKVDLKSQLMNLLTPTQLVYDVNIVKLGTDGVLTLMEIAISRKLKLPIEGIVYVIQCCIANYYTGIGVVKIWKKFLNSVQNLLQYSLDSLPHVIQFLTLSRTINNGIVPDKISTDICQLFSIICTSLVGLKDSLKPTYLKTIEQLEEFVEFFLHKQMGRFPLPSVNEETKVVNLVEILITLWVQCVYLLNGNWERLVLQTFPYTGNHQLREQFVLYFYSNILKFNVLKSCQDIVIRTVLKDLVKFSPSSYLGVLMGKLAKAKWDSFVFPKHVDITFSRIQNSRHSVISTIVQNITNPLNYSKDDQRIYIREILTTLNSEFEKYYSSTRYKTFCSHVVKEIQKKCDPDIVDESTVYNLASRVGILESEWTQFKIQKLPLKQKLETFATEFHNALHFGGDSISVLEKFTFGDGVELIYHLVSMYSQDILIGRITSWKIIHVLLEFFDKNVRNFKFQILNFSFKRFLRLLMEMPVIKCPSSIPDRFFRISTMRSICSILNFCKVIFNGYKDSQEVDEMWTSFKQTSRQEQYESQNLECPYSSFKLQEIIDNRFVNELVLEEITQDTLDIAKRMLISETFLLKTNMVDSENRLLEYNFVL